MIPALQCIKSLSSLEGGFKKQLHPRQCECRRGSFLQSLGAAGEKALSVRSLHLDFGTFKKIISIIRIQKNKLIGKLP